MNLFGLTWHTHAYAWYTGLAVLWYTDVLMYTVDMLGPSFGHTGLSFLVQAICLVLRLWYTELFCPGIRLA